MFLVRILLMEEFWRLLTEIFDKVGIGTMIHANEYQKIRPARKKTSNLYLTLLVTAHALMPCAH